MVIKEKSHIYLFDFSTLPVWNFIGTDGKGIFHIAHRGCS